ncbi:serine hydrolase FSH [Xylaria cf. heliscus]|nr:serine hydrolase FSH [Xylaria cf. heliscus]
MRILCLHGYNQNGQTFRKQLQTAIKMIEDSETDVSFDFADAPKQCAGSLSDGQAMYKFFDVPALAEIGKALEWLQLKLDTDGPYDGVIGFSQGATLVSSYLLYHHCYNDQQSTPFKFATFISGSLSLEVLKNLGVPVPKAAEHIVEETERCRQEHLGPPSSHVLQARRAMFDSTDCFGLNWNTIRRELKFRIPTVHVWGADDPGFPTSIHLAGLCDPYLRKVYIHDGAHEVPQQTEENRQQLGQLVLWCMQRATWPGQSQSQ